MDHPDLFLREEIARYCAASPSAQHNGIACVNRIWNVAWRGMKRELVKMLFMNFNQYLTTQTVPDSESIQQLVDLEDVAV